MSEIVKQFIEQPVRSVEEQPGGHIHDSYLVTTGEEPVSRFILQRLNTRIFNKPQKLMENFSLICAHLERKMATKKGTTLSLELTLDGKPFYVGPDGGCWRMFTYIEDSYTIGVAENLDQIRHAARVTGEFLRTLADFPTDQLFIPLPDFHHTPRRYEQLQLAVQRDACERCTGVQAEIAFIDERAQDLHFAQQGLENGSLPWRVTHNDTKLENILFSKISDDALCLIDLDTVMPGSLLYDFGDAIRSMGNSAAEDEPDLRRVHFRMDVYDAYTQGFVRAARTMLVDEEIRLLPLAPWLITLENGIRFLTDYLQGDTYFKTRHPLHNLERCRTQLKLVREMEIRREDMTHRVMNSLLG